MKSHQSCFDSYLCRAPQTTSHYSCTQTREASGTRCMDGKLTLSECQASFVAPASLEIELPFACANCIHTSAISIPE